MNYIVYETTNKQSGKYYIGVHKQAKDPWKEDGYYGSNEIILRLDKDLLFRDTLFVFSNHEDAYQKEDEIVDQKLVSNSHCYNQKTGGMGGWLHVTQESRVKGGKSTANIKHSDPERWKLIIAKRCKSRGKKGNSPGNNFRGIPVVAGNMLFPSSEHAARFYSVSGNTIRKRINSNTNGYYKQ